MSLGLALCGQDFVLVAADKQETNQLKFGGRHTTLVCKIEEIGNSCVLVAAGPDWGTVLFKTVIEEIEYRSLLDNTPITQLTSNLYEEYIKIPRERFSQSGPQFLQFLLAGFDTESNPLLWSFSSPDFSPKPSDLWNIAGMGAQSQYFLSAIYKEQASVEELALLACFCIRETSKQDKFVSEELDMVVIRQDGIENIGDDAILRFSARAEEISISIKREFHL